MYRTHQERSYDFNTPSKACPAPLNPTQILASDRDTDVITDVVDISTTGIFYVNYEEVNSDGPFSENHDAVRQNSQATNIRVQQTVQ